MTTEQKVCQNCKTNFTIEPEDFAFYKKIDVPAPTFCPRLAQTASTLSAGCSIF